MNIDYKDKLTFIANTFAVDPDLLESVMYYMSRYIEIGDPAAVSAMASRIRLKEESKKTTSKKKSTSKKTEKKDEVEEEISEMDIPVTEGSVSATLSYYIKPGFKASSLQNELKNLYRFVDVIESNNTIRIEGLVNSKYQYVFINDKFISSCIPLIKAIKNNTALYYKVDGEDISLYTLMCKFDDMIPSGLTRYKGLGEQNPTQLGVSALRPDGDRTLIRYTLESAKEEIETLRRIDNSMASLLRDTSITKADIE